MLQFPDIPSYRAQATHIYWEPIAGSGERITAAVALTDSCSEVRVVSLISQDILSLLYRGQGVNAASLIGMMTDSLKAFLKTGRDVSEWQPPASGFMAAPLREYAGFSASDVIDQVAGLHSSLFKAKPPTKEEKSATVSNAKIYKEVRDAARQIACLEADRIFTPKGIIEVSDQGQIHQLEIPIKTDTKVGSIISAWYASASTIETHYLRAQSNLAVASERKKYGAGLFISRPSDSAYYSNQDKVDNLIDDIYWRVKRLGYYLEVRETPKALAEEILSWAA